MIGLVIVAIASAASFFAILSFGIGYNMAGQRIYGGLVGIILALGLFCVYICGIKNQNKAMTERYNDGICTVCGGEYEFAGGSRYRNNSEYYYTCENCGHTITTSSIMK